jgi:DnaK suppressor protein
MSGTLDPAFIGKQRKYLQDLQASLRAGAQRAEVEEDDSRSQLAGGAREAEEEAQKLDALELEGNVVVRNVNRLERVDRALKKIDEGTYGLSDVSGKPIPRDRLEAVPEAVCTLSEETTFEGQR